jgi:hypothetical protein
VNKHGTRRPALPASDVDKLLATKPAPPARMASAALASAQQRKPLPWRDLSKKLTHRPSIRLNKPPPSLLAHGRWLLRPYSMCLLSSAYASDYDLPYAPCHARLRAAASACLQRGLQRKATATKCKSIALTARSSRTANLTSPNIGPALIDTATKRHQRLQIEHTAIDQSATRRSSPQALLSKTLKFCPRSVTPLLGLITIILGVSASVLSPARAGRAERA